MSLDVDLSLLPKFGALGSFLCLVVFLLRTVTTKQVANIPARLLIFLIFLTLCFSGLFIFDRLAPVKKIIVEHVQDKVPVYELPKTSIVIQDLPEAEDLTNDLRFTYKVPLNFARDPQGRLYEAKMSGVREDVSLTISMYKFREWYNEYKNSQNTLKKLTKGQAENVAKTEDASIVERATLQDSSHEPQI